MTRRTNAGIAGFTFLFYMAVAYPSLVLLQKATGGPDVAAKLANIAQHAADVRLAALLSLLGCLSALVLAVTLYAITRDQDPDLALLGLTCRVGEGAVGAASLPGTLQLLWLGTAAKSASDAGPLNTLGAYLLADSGLGTIPAFLFVVGSTVFAYLLLRGRIVPTPLAWLGIVASLLAVVGVPLQILDILPGFLSRLLWMPMLAYEVPLGLWLLIKGAAVPARVAEHSQVR